VGFAAAVPTDLSATLAAKDRVNYGLGVYEKGSAANLVRTEAGLQALLAVFQAEQTLELALESRVVVP
jgi:hypothetical protein